jgi:hypothetical protein
MQGVATVACVPSSATCEGVANTLELNGEPLPVGPSADYAKAVDGALGKLNTAVAAGNKAMNSAKRPSAQAAAARQLQNAYAKAAKSLRGQRLSPADRGANARLVAALSGAAKAYGQGAAAAKNNSKAGFKRAGASVTKARQQLAGALAGLKAAGYDLQS